MSENNEVPAGDVMVETTGETAETLSAEKPAQESPTQEVPTQETPAQETQAQETPAQETPAQKTPAQETPAPETPAPETPAKETPAQETPAQETPEKVQNGRPKWKQPTITTPNNRCKICQKTVYPMEKITADGFNYHKLCFRCTECNTLLSLGNFAQSKQFLYCKHHFKQLFKLKGNYDDAFDGSSRSSRKAGVADSGTHK